MAKKRAGHEKVKVVLEEEDDDDDDLDLKGVRGGGVERYEVRVEPPIVSGRRAKAVRTAEEMSGSSEVPKGQAMGSMAGSNSRQAVAVQTSGSSQQIYKIEDDLRRTRDIVEDLRHTTSVMEGEFKDLKAEMDRISYLLRSLEGLKNTMKDIESTVSELSGLYDMISASVNPFIDIQPIPPSNGNGIPKDKVVKPLQRNDEETVEEAFKELSDIFEDEEELDEAEEWEGPDLMSEEWLLRWTQFLIDKVGKDGLERTLNYYQDLGWIEDDMIEKVLDIARGTTGPVRKDDGKKSTWRMDAEDHVKSLEFIRRVKAR